MPAPAYDRLCDYLRETALLDSTRRLLAWDQQTYLPRQGSRLRARQLAQLAGLVHRRRAAPELGDLLDEAGGRADGDDPDSEIAANLREARRDFDRATRVPVSLVEERAHTAALAQPAWADARAASDFATFQPWLEKIFHLARRYAEALGYDEHPYDALLDLYEPGCTRAGLRALFAPLARAHADLAQRIREKGGEVDGSCLRRTFPVAAQESFAREVLGAVGFDFERGRLDPTVHPFCTGIGPGDVRLTTRWDEGFFGDGLFSVLHEAGHGTYEQGLDPKKHGLPSGQPCSLGMHESQSRMWENLVGRSRGFWRRWFPPLEEAFPDALRGVHEEDFYRAVNEIRPGFIRVDADEVTYNLHVVLRFDLEQALLTGDLPVADLPAAWNRRFESLFGRTPPDDARGCLQDVHWSGGMVGYFPTYALGNVYAAQLFEAAERDLGELEPAFAAGEFAPLLRWLNEKVHRRGRLHEPRRLLEGITGAPPTPKPLIRRLEAKFGAIYGL